MVKKAFSIIELMTVVFVILVIGLFTIPQIGNIYRNSHSIICKNNLKQLGALSFTYALDHDGFLPGERTDDVSQVGGKNNGLYANWNGHLIPYIDNELREYHRDAKLYKDGIVYSVDNPNPKNKNKNGYIFVEEAYRSGGYGDFKVMICPEALKAVDEWSMRETGVAVPRILGLSNSYFLENLNYNLTSGFPTSYHANNVLFSAEGMKKRRYQEVKNLSQKILLNEGSAPTTNKGDSLQYRFYFDADKTSLDHQDFVYGGERQNPVSSVLADSNRVVQSFYHGTTYGEDFYAVASASNGMILQNHVVESFNKQFGPRTFLARSIDKSGNTNWGNIKVVLVSFDNSKVLSSQAIKDFENSFNIKFPAWSLVPFESRPYAAGQCNVLKGDGSVTLEHQADLYNHSFEWLAIDE